MSRALGLIPKVDEHAFAAFEESKCVVAVERPLPELWTILLKADVEIGWNCYVHHLRIRQVEAIHDVYVLLDGANLETRVASLLLSNGAHCVALIIVGGINKSLVGQLQQAIEYGIILIDGIAVLEVGPSRTADQQSVAREYAVTHEKAVGLACMA